MPRNLPAPIKTELGQTTLAAPIWCLRVTRKAGILRWSEKGNGPTGLVFNDGTGTQTYEVRIQSISGFQFSTDDGGAVSITLANPDDAITVLDRAESFAGAKAELIAYLPGIDSYFLAWAGWCDDISEITPETATLKAYPTVSIPYVQVPKRTVDLACRHEFANTANFVNYKDFEGSECLYGLNSNVGARATLSGAMDATSDPVTFTATWTPVPVSEGAKFSKGDVLLIGSEKLLITNSPADPDGSYQQSVIASRGYLGTAKATHSDADTIFFGNCLYSVSACKRRLMYGNNILDSFGAGLYLSNYFGGFPFTVGYQHGRYRSKSGERPKPLRLTYSGNESAYGRTIGLAYGRVRISDPILLLAKPEGDFLTTLWAVCEGVLATNITNDDQTTPSNAYVKTNGVENIYVNGEDRHDKQYPSEIYNGTQSEPNISAAFFPAGAGQINDFVQNYLGFWGTARVAIRINTKSNPSVDLNAGSITGAMEIRYGRVVRQYSDSITYTRKATTSPAWVQLDVLTSKRAGAGLDFGRFNIQSFIDLASYCGTLITNTIDGTQVPRWTFNGILDQRRSMQEWMHLISIGMYSLPPFLDKDGLLKVKPLKSEDLSSVPLFSSKVASTTGRNILWNGNRSSLVKSRRPITEIPNEITVNFVEKSYDTGFTATLQNDLNNSSNPVSVTGRWDATALASGTKFKQSDVILINSEKLLITNTPADPNGSGDQFLTCQRAYGGSSIAPHTHGATIQFQAQGYAKVSVVISDRDVQAELGKKMGDGSRRVISKSIDLPGTSTLDEAVRLGTLVLRAGEFGEGGLSNNLKVVFNCYHRDATDLEQGDPIQVEDDLLSAANGEQYFRVISISAQPISIPDAGFDFIRQVEAVLHSNAIYDDGAISVSEFTRIDAPGANDAEAPAVTGFSVVESGIFDANNKPTTNLVFNYTEPDPKLNFRSVAIHVSNDDGAGHPVGDWRYIGDVYSSGQTIINFEVTNTLKWFCAVSRTLAGNVPDVNAQLADSSYKYPRFQVLVDGMVDTLSAPSAFQIFIGSNLVTLRWDPYVSSNLKLFKAFRIYRNTINDLASASLIHVLDGTLFIDASVAAGTTYYYWVKGLSILNVEGTAAGPVTTTSPANAGTDTTVPDAPVIGTDRGVGSLNSNEYTWTVGIDRPGGAANWNGITLTEIQISTDQTFATFPTGQSLNRSYGHAPGITEVFKVNTPGTYYFRARVKNAFGYSAYSSTLSRTTNFTDNLTADTTIPGAPDNLTIKKQSDNSAIGGNEFEVSWTIPSAQTGSYFGYSVYIHDSSTLPTATKQYDGIASGKTIAVVAGSQVLTASTSPGWTVNAYAGKDVVVFDPSRGGSPTFDYEGAFLLAKITANTANTLLIDTPIERITRNISGCGFFIVNNGVGDHFFEKLKFSTPALNNEGVLSPVEERGSRVRKLKFVSGIATVNVWVALYNSFGQGKVTASPPTATFTGISTTELKDAAVIASKLTKNSQGWTTDLSFSASDYRTVAWGSGTIKTADGSTYSIGAGNTGAMAALTYIYFDPTVSTTVLQTTTTYSTVAGENVIIVCIAKNTSDTSQNAFFVPEVGTFGINETVIGPNSISTGKIQALAITTGLLAASSVTAAKISVANLAVINVDAGTITAGTLIGATIKTASSGTRIEIDSTNGLRAYNGSTLTSQIDLSGARLKGLWIQGLTNDLTLLTNDSNGELLISQNSGHPVIEWFNIADIGVSSAWSIDTKINHSIDTQIASGKKIYFNGDTTHGAIDGNSTQVRVFWNGTNVAYFDSSGNIALGGSVVLNSGQGVKDGGSNSSFTVTSTVAQIYANGGVQVAEFGTGAIKLYLSGALRTMSVFNDGAGHNIPYY